MISSRIFILSSLCLLWCTACSLFATCTSEENDLFTAEKTFLNIEEAEIIAINNNPKLQETKYQAESSYWTYQNRLSRMFPQISYTQTTGTSNELPRTAFFLGRYVRYHTETLSFDQLVLSLSTYYDTKSFDWQFASDFFSYLEELVQTLASIRIAHCQVIATRQLIQVQQTILDLYKEAYENEEVKLTVGESTNFENIRNKLAYTNTLSDYYRAVDNAQIAWDNWIRVLGVDPEETTDYDVAETEIPIENTPFLMELFKRVENSHRQIKTDLFTSDELYYWRTLAAFYRPLVKQFQAAYESADMKLKSSWGTYIPEVSLFSDYTVNNPPEFFTTRMRFQNYGIRVTWPIFDSFGRESNVYQNRANKEVAKWTADGAWYGVQLEVADRSYDLQQALYSVKSSLEGQTLSNEGIEDAKTLLKLGDLTLFEYRDMIQSLGLAEINLTQARFNLIASYYSLIAAVGLQNRDSAMFLLKEGFEHND